MRAARCHEHGGTPHECWPQHWPSASGADLSEPPASRIRRIHVALQSGEALWDHDREWARQFENVERLIAERESG